MFNNQITKPLLERKRRARINRCLDELKDLMVDALEVGGLMLFVISIKYLVL